MEGFQLSVYQVTQILETIFPQEFGDLPIEIYLAGRLVVFCSLCRIPCCCEQPTKLGSSNLPMSWPLQTKLSWTSLSAANFYMRIYYMSLRKSRSRGIRLSKIPLRLNRFQGISFVSTDISG